MSSSRIRAIYRVSGQNPDARAREIALEQTVEVPESLVAGTEILERVVGRVESVEPSGAGFRAVISYAPELAAGEIPQLLNLLYGNVSIQEGVRLEDVELPDSVLAGFRGPNFGIAGLRDMLGIRDRPLLATALKPKGAPSEDLVRIAGEFARGGGDIVKDDQNLADGDFDQFRDRVGRCQEAVDTANARTGGKTLFCPILSGPAPELEARLDAMIAFGVRGVLVCPMLLGLDTVRWLAGSRKLAVLAHPSFTGTFFQDRKHGMPPGLLLGKLFRLIGADVSIFPNRGGRFSFTREECDGISAAMTGPLGDIAPGFPAPAGGMQLENIPQMCADYGKDAAFLIGGALLAHPGGVETGTRAFLGGIEDFFKEKQ